MQYCVIFHLHFSAYYSRRDALFGLCLAVPLGWPPSVMHWVLRLAVAFPVAVFLKAAFHHLVGVIGDCPGCRAGRNMGLEVTCRDPGNYQCSGKHCPLNSGYVCFFFIQWLDNFGGPAAFSHLFWPPYVVESIWPDLGDLCDMWPGDPSSEAWQKPPSPKSSTHFPISSPLSCLATDILETALWKYSL
jgi:hypothetical protein